MTHGRKYTLGIDENTILFEVSKENSVENWISPFQDITAIGLYGELKVNREFIYNLCFAFSVCGTHFIWDDIESLGKHFFLSRQEWNDFLYLTCLKCDEESVGVDWKREGF